MLNYPASVTNNRLAVRFELIDAARYFYRREWMLGTAGNLSARIADDSFWITASGKAKGELTTSDFVRVALDGEILERESTQIKPSAETIIHQTIYSLFPAAQACYHVHSIEANLVSHFTDRDDLLLPPLEMLKGLGIGEETPQVTISVFENYLEVSRIAAEISDRFCTTSPQISALLIRNHGVTVWANSLVSARNYIELIEYIFRYMVAARQVGIS